MLVHLRLLKAHLSTSSIKIAKVRVVMAGETIIVKSPLTNFSTMAHQISLHLEV